MKRDEEIKAIVAERDASDHRTLDKIAEDDMEMLEHALKNTTTHWFNTPAEAMHFQGAKMFGLLRRLGIKVNQKMDGKMVDRMMKVKDVKVEQRKYDEELTAWRSGTYIYQGKELVGWISRGTRMFRSPLSIHFEWRVQTNIK